MTKDTSLLSTEALERQLDRIQSFIPRIDARVGAYIAIISAQIAVAAINLSVSDLRTMWMVFMVVFFICSSAWAFLNLFMCTHPNLEGGAQSLIYFGEISKMEEADYVSKFSGVTEPEFRSDLAKQIHRNSQIVAQKYANLSQAGTSLLVGMIPWTLILVGSSMANGTIPAITN